MPMDYFPLLSGAVSALDQNTAEARRSVYDRARRILAPDIPAPFVTESGLKEELLALEVAIRRVEAEATRSDTIVEDGAEEKSATYRSIAPDIPVREVQKRSLFRRAAARVIFAATILFIAAAAYAVAIGLIDMSSITDWRIGKLFI